MNSEWALTLPNAITRSDARKKIHDRVAHHTMQSADVVLRDYRLRDFIRMVEEYDSNLECSEEWRRFWSVNQSPGLVQVQVAFDPVVLPSNYRINGLRTHPQVSTTEQARLALEKGIENVPAVTEKLQSSIRPGLIGFLLLFGLGSMALMWMAALGFALLFSSITILLASLFMDWMVSGQSYISARSLAIGLFISSSLCIVSVVAGIERFFWS